MNLFKQILMITVLIGVALSQQVAFCMNQQAHANKVQFNATQVQKTQSLTERMLAKVRAMKNWVVANKKPLLIGAVVVGIACLIAAGYGRAGSQNYFDTTASADKPQNSAPASSLGGNTAQNKPDNTVSSKPESKSASWPNFYIDRKDCNDKTGSYECRIFAVKGKGTITCTHFFYGEKKVSDYCEEMLQEFFGPIFQKYGSEAPKISFRGSPEGN